MLLSKVSNISFDISDCFTSQQMELCFSSLKEIADAQNKALEEDLNKAKNN